MLLTDAHRAIIRNYLQRIIPDWTCPMCGHDQYSINDELVCLIVFEGDNTSPNNLLRYVSLICDKCAYEMLFVADRLGIN